MNLNDVGTIIRVVDSKEKARLVHYILDTYHVPHRTFKKPSKQFPGVIMYAVVSDGYISNEDLGLLNRIVDTRVPVIQALQDEANKRS